MTRILIQGGTVVTMDPGLGELERGDVLIEDGRIASVAPSIPADGADVIDATGMVVMPGLADSHRHLWYTALPGTGMDHALGELGPTTFNVGARFNPEDLYNSTRAGIVFALDSGITTVLDECQQMRTPEHAAAAVQAHLETPGRSVFTVGPEHSSTDDDLPDWSRARGLRSNEFSSHERKTLALAVPDPAYPEVEATRATVRTARELGVGMQFNVGIPMGPPPAGGIKKLGELGLIGADMNFVHCNTTSDDEFRMMAAEGATTGTSAPWTEIAVGIGFPSLGRMLKCGIAPGVGTDALSAANGDLFENARLSLLLDRARGSAEVFEQGRAIATAAELGMTSRQALETITINGARACGLGDTTGSLTPGKAADVILLRGSDLSLSALSEVVGLLVCSAHGSMVDTVLVGGDVVKRHGKLVGLDRSAIEQALVHTQERIRTPAGAGVA